MAFLASPARSIRDGLRRLCICLLDADYRLYTDPSWPIRTSEVMITMAYKYELRSGWSLQPNVQYIIRPGGGAANPLSATPGWVLKDAAVFGLRTVVKF